jgi:ABC-type sulfate/molybdate transport systems ATPase subunit
MKATEALEWADEILVLEHGRIVQRDSKSKVLAESAVRSIR